RHAEDTWLYLRRPAYVSNTQASGLVFSRATALEWARRSAAVAPIMQSRQLTPTGEWPPCSSIQPKLSATDIRDVCRSAPGLGGVVVAGGVTGLAGMGFHTPVPMASVCRKADATVVVRD